MTPDEIVAQADACAKLADSETLPALSGEWLRLALEWMKLAISMADDGSEFTAPMRRSRKPAAEGQALV